MSEGNPLIYPENPDEYFVYGSYVAPNNNWGWHFGYGTSQTCAAMPFRGGNGLGSSNCLRGEDWVYMADWAVDRYHLPNGLAIEPALYLYGPYSVIERGPDRQQLTSMYANLRELSTVYGSDFTFQDQVVERGQHYSINEAVGEVLLSSLDPVSLQSQEPPQTPNAPLLKSRIQTFFSDMA